MKIIINKELFASPWLDNAAMKSCVSWPLTTNQLRQMVALCVNVAEPNIFRSLWGKRLSNTSNGGGLCLWWFMPSQNHLAAGQDIYCKIIFAWWINMSVFTVWNHFTQSEKAIGRSRCHKNANKFIYGVYITFV